MERTIYEIVADIKAKKEEYRISVVGCSQNIFREYALF